MNFRVEMANTHVKEKSYKTFYFKLKILAFVRANLKSSHIIYGLTRIPVYIVKCTYSMGCVKNRLIIQRIKARRTRLKKLQAEDDRQLARTFYDLISW